MIPKQTRITAWYGPLPEPGEFLRSQGGSLYLVLSRRDNQRPKHVRKSRCHLPPRQAGAGRGAAARRGRARLPVERPWLSLGRTRRRKRLSRATVLRTQ